jgi:hypothetical protein
VNGGWGESKVWVNGTLLLRWRRPYWQIPMGAYYETRTAPEQTEFYVGSRQVDEETFNTIANEVRRRYS